jgi:V/A-type H+-transporting ATPase subunit A
VYERAGIIRTNDGSIGSLTMIGTVSPAGGNFEEPVTQSTLSTVKAFLGLSADRAYKRFYPAVDILISWSRYFDQLGGWFAKNLDPDWVGRVKKMNELLQTGDSIDQMIKVTGEEGVGLEDFITFQKSLFLDMVYLQQDAFDDVDATCPLERQKRSFDLISRLLDQEYRFADKNAARDYFVRLTGLYKNLNYAADGSPAYRDYFEQIQKLASSVSGAVSEASTLAAPAVAAVASAPRS